MKHPFLPIAALMTLVCSCADTDLAGRGGGSDRILFEVADLAALPARSRATASDSAAATAPVPATLEAEGGTSLPTLYLHSQERVNDYALLPQYANASDTLTASRATPVRDHDIFADLYGEFTVEAWCKSQPYIQSEKIEAHTATIWRPDQTHYWPLTDKVDFYAYAPTQALASIINIDDTRKEMSFTHTTPATAAEQTDLLVATVACGKSEAVDGHAPMRFHHPLSAVTFRAKAALPGLEINSITLSGLADKGHCLVTRSATEPIVWSDLSAQTGTFTQEFDVTIPGTGEGEITEKDLSTTFLVIPQTLDKAVVTVKGTTGWGEKVTLTAPLKTAQFAEYLPGMEYVYCISTNSINWEYHFTATKQVTLSDGIVVGDYRVSSYRKNLITQEKVPLRWTGVFDDSTRVNNYVPVYTLEGPGGTSKQYDLKCKPQHLWTSTYEGDNLLRDSVISAWVHGPGGSHDPQDLSYRLLEDGSRETYRSTANCYKVHSPGIYAIPLVYGNAIYKDNVNSRAYTLPYTAGEYQMKHHKRLDNNDITQPWVDVDYSISEPKEVWEDAPGLIINVRDTVMTDGFGTHHYILFEVPRSNIVQGNAILAAREKKADGTPGRVVWSWHVWVTDYDRFSFPNVDVASIKYPGRHYRFFTHKLGECAAKTLIYQERVSICTYTQAESGKTCQTQIIQQEFPMHTFVPNGTYYQWGRKDPIIGIAKHEATSVKPYFIDDIRQDTIAYATQYPGNTDVYNTNRHILYPEKMLAGAKTNYDGSGYPNDYLNAWDNRDKDATVSIKTVYDPSPAGYKVAPDYAYEVFMRQYTPYQGDHAYMEVQCTPYAGSGSIPKNAHDPETGQVLRASDLTLNYFNSFLNGTHSHNNADHNADRNYTFTVYPEPDKKGTPITMYATGQRWSTSHTTAFKNTEMMNPHYVYIWVSGSFDYKTSRCFVLGYDPGKEVSIWVGRSNTGRHSMARPVYYIKHETQEEQEM